MGNSSSGDVSTAHSIALMTSSCAASLAGSRSVTEMTRPSPRPGTDSHALDASRTSGMELSAARISVSSATRSTIGWPIRIWRLSLSAR